MAIAWIPKATVQAAMGSIPLDIAREQLMKAREHPHEADDEAWAKHVQVLEDHVKYGKYIITVAVLAILISAPIGAIGIRYSPRLPSSPGNGKQPWSKIPRLSNFFRLG